MREGTLLGELKGAPLRCTLEGARYTRPGLMVVGEAAGSTYTFTGEGIGKAMQTGMAAADALLALAPAAQRAPSAADDAQVRSAYEAALLALAPKFRMYERANAVNATPWFLDLLIWRAQRSPRLVQRMQGVLDETSNPGNLVGVRGLWRILTT
jgi:flavin-dependent dehydrogenase